jgi:predicted TIM-barrel fold metal-dependent hydrolase
MHGHYGPTGELLLRNSRDAIPDDFTRPPLPDDPGVTIGGQNPLHQAWMQGGDASTVVSRARQANIGLTVVSPLRGLMPRGRWGKGGADAFAGNQECFDTVQGSDELLQWCIVNPADPRTFEQADAMLRSDNCVGLKFHPEEHCYTLAEHGEELFKFAAARSATVLVHSGDRHSAPMDFLPFADAHPEIKLVLAHLGNSGDMKAGKGGGDPTHQLRAIGASRNHNIYVDTSSAASITPGLIECAFPCLLRACTP